MTKIKNLFIYSIYDQIDRLLDVYIAYVDLFLYVLGKYEKK